MKYAIPVALLILAGCSSTPTAPTAPPVAATPIPVTPPVTAPPVVTPPANPLLSDPRFSLDFYRMFVLGSQDGPLQSLRRQTEAPSIYLRTIDDAGIAIDAVTLEQTAAALINTTGQLTGAFGLAGMERGTGTREGQNGWITVRWSATNTGHCGQAAIGGDLLTLEPKTPGCRCGGGPAVSLSTVKHELGHALGFYHTDTNTDLMFPRLTACDMTPSAREIFHAKIAYGQAIGSLDPK